MDTNIIGTAVFVAAFLLNLGMFVILRQRPVVLYSDETVNLSDCLLRRSQLPPPYMFAHRPVMHALHRRLMKIFKDDIIRAGRAINFGFIVLHIAAVIVFLSRHYSYPIVMIAVSWWMTCGAALGTTVVRIANFTERALGDLAVFSGFAAFLMTDPKLGVLMQIGAAAIFWAMVWHSSKFGVQAIVLVASATFGLTGNWPLILAVILSFGISYALFGREVLHQLRDQLGHLSWYLKYGHYFLSHEARGNCPRNIPRWAWKIYNSVPSRHLFLLLPLSIPTVAAWLFFGPPRYSPMWGVTAAAILVSAVVVMGRAAVIGPSCRYLYVTGLPIIFADLLVYTPRIAEFLFVADAGFGVVVGILFAWRARKAAMDWNADLAELRWTFHPIETEQINVVSDPIRIAEMIGAIVHLPRFRIATFGFSPKNVAFLGKYYPRYPALTSDSGKLRELIEEFDIEAVVVDKKVSSLSKISAFESLGFSRTREGNRFLLLCLKSSDDIRPVPRWQR